MVFIVAEIGINWDGDFELVKDLMKMQKRQDLMLLNFRRLTKTLQKIIQNLIDY